MKVNEKLKKVKKLLLKVTKKLKKVKKLLLKVTKKLKTIKKLLSGGQKSCQKVEKSWKVTFESYPVAKFNFRKLLSKTKKS